MYCKHCGNQIEEGSVFCAHCGQKVQETTIETSIQPNQTIETTSTTSTKSENPAQTTAIIGFVLAFFVSIAGLIVSSIALKKYSTQENQEGRGLAVAGLVVSIVSVSIAAIYFLFVIAILAITL